MVPTKYLGHVVCRRARDEKSASIQVDPVYDSGYVQFLMNQLGFDLVNSAKAETQEKQKEAETKEADKQPVAQKEDDKEPENRVLSVSQINKAIKGQLESRFDHLWVQGEISNFTAHASGHFYFSLKDNKAQISAVMFKGSNRSLKFRPESGMEVIVRGRISVYEPRGSYQIMCTHMEPMGAGALQLAFEQLKKKLDKEGLFDPSHKKALPKIPHHIAVITSPTGAAIRDIINVLNRRFKNAQVTVIPTLVQGASAAQSILASLDQAQRFNQQKPIDVLIVGRGGGSIEDLWCFNDEAVARAIYACPIPVVSAVGHEIDFTISDFVADLRAPTPSAAAELVVRSSEELNRFIVNYSKQMFRRMKNILQQSQQRLIHLEKRVVDPQRKLQDLMLRLDELNMRLNNSVRRNLFQIQNHVVHLSKRIVNPLVLVKNLQNRHHLLSRNLLVVIEGLVEKKKYKYDRLNSLLDSYSPLRVVDRGYSLVLDEKKGLIKSVQQLKVNDKIQIQLKDGMAYAHVDKVTKGDK